MDKQNSDPGAAAPNHLMRDSLINRLATGVIHEFGDDNTPLLSHDSNFYRRSDILPVPVYLDTTGSVHFDENWRTHHQTIRNGLDYELIYGLHTGTDGRKFSMVMVDCYDEGILGKRIIYLHDADGSIIEVTSENTGREGQLEYPEGSLRTLDDTEAYEFFQAMSDPISNAKEIHAMLDSYSSVENATVSVERGGLIRLDQPEKRILGGVAVDHVVVDEEAAERLHLVVDRLPLLPQPRKLRKLKTSAGSVVASVPMNSVSE